MAVASSKGSCSTPSARIRPGTSKVSLLGTSGSGKGTVLSKGSTRPPSRSSRTSGCPLVVMKATRQVPPVSTAFVARVVACMKRLQLPSSPARGTPAAPAARSSTSNTPRTGSSGVVGALNSSKRPSSCSITRSVKVPPTSADSRIPPPSWGFSGPTYQLLVKQVDSRSPSPRGLTPALARAEGFAGVTESTLEHHLPSFPWIERATVEDRFVAWDRITGIARQ